MHKTMSLGSCHFILEQTWSVPCLRKAFSKMAENLAADSRNPQTVGCSRNDTELWRVDGFVLSNHIRGGRR